MDLFLARDIIVSLHKLIKNNSFIEKDKEGVRLGTLIL